MIVLINIFVEIYIFFQDFQSLLLLLINFIHPHWIKVSVSLKNCIDPTLLRLYWLYSLNLTLILCLKCTTLFFLSSVLCSHHTSWVSGWISMGKLAVCCASSVPQLWFSMLRKKKRLLLWQRWQRNSKIQVVFYLIYKYTIASHELCTVFYNSCLSCMYHRIHRFCCLHCRD